MKPYCAKIIVEETGVNFFAWSIITDGFFKLPYIKKFLGTPLKLEVMWIENDHGRWASDIQTVKDLSFSAIKKIESNTFPIKKMSLLHRQYGQKILNSCKKLHELADFLTPAQLVNLLDKTWDDFMKLNCLGVVLVWSDMEHSMLTKTLEKILISKGIESDKISGLLNCLIGVLEPTKPWEEKVALLKIALQFKTYKAAVASKEFSEHCKKYSWVQYGYQGPESSFSCFSDNLKKIFSSPSFSSIKQEYQSHLQRFNVLRKKRIRTEKALKLSLKEKQLFAAARETMYLKAYRIDVRHYFHWVMDKIFQQLGKKHNIPLSWFHYADRKDILNLIRTGRINLTEGLKRSKFIFRVTEGKKIKFLNQFQAKRFLKQYLQKDIITQAQEITGNVAFPGMVQGIARIVFSIKDINKVEEGNILVALATNPDLLPAMIKAGAFVTDAGGITSHAAIVAREMKKPCVIGTKIATKILHDGNFIEVDANKGVVRIIKK